MQLSVIVAVLAALVISENSPHEPVSGAGLRLMSVVAMVIGVVAFAMIGSGGIARRLRTEYDRRYGLLRTFRRLRQVHSLLWIAAVGATLYGLDWARMVRFNWHLNRVPVVDDVLVLTPVVLPLVLSWVGFFEVERALQSSLVTRWEYVTLQLRHCLGLLLLPVLGLAAVQDFAQLLVPELSEGPYSGVLYLPPLLILFAFFPTLLRYVWKTEPLADGSLRDRLEAVADRAGFRCRQILVWRTNGTLANAAVAGFLPSLRYVFLTDGLVSQLSDAEIEAVFGHEVGHVRHRHLLLRVIAMVAPVSLWFLVDRLCPAVSHRVQEVLLSGGVNAQVTLGLLTLAAMASYGMVVFGPYSRLLEGQADLFGCRSLDAQGDTPAVETFVSALEKLAAFSGMERNVASWQHASIARRVEFLYRAERDPCYEGCFHRRIWWLSGILTATAISPMIYLMIR